MVKASQLVGKGGIFSVVDGLKLFGTIIESLPVYFYQHGNSTCDFMDEIVDETVVKWYTSQHLIEEKFIKYTVENISQIKEDYSKPILSGTQSGDWSGIGFYLCLLYMNELVETPQIAGDQLI